MRASRYIYGLVSALLSVCIYTGCAVNSAPINTVPPTPVTHNIGCWLRDKATDQPLDQALCTVTGSTIYQGWTNSDGFVLLTKVPAGKLTVTGHDPGYTDVVSPEIDNSIDQSNVTLALPSILPQPVALAPLALEADSDGDVCHHDLPAGLTIPDGPDRRFWRGDAWGVTVANLPFVYAGSSRHPERALSWFLDRWALDSQADIINANRRHGYTHFTLSWPDSRVSGGLDNAGQSPQQFAATAARVHTAIPFVHVMLTSKDFDPANADAVTRMDAVSPVIDALIAAGFDGDSLILGVGWELDLFNEGQALENFVHLLHARYPQFDLYAHFTSYKTSWQPDGQPRAQFWQVTQGELTGLLYQGNPSDSCGLMQAHFDDALVPASGISAAGGIVVPWELVAAAEFDNDHPNEDDANARGWELLATPGPMFASGGGNGFRFPSGAPTLTAYPVPR